MKLLILVCFITLAFGDLLFSDEKYFKNVRQLTFGGDHSFPDFSDDGSQLVFAAHGGPYGIDCDQVFRLNLRDLTEKPSRLSPGFGYASRPKFWPNTQDVVFQANFHKTVLPDDFTASKSCPMKTCDPANQQSNSTIAALCKTPSWDIFPNQDIFRVTKYGNIVQEYTNNSIYAGDAWGKKDDGMIYYAAKDNNGVNVYTADVTLLSTPSLLTHQKGINFFGGIAKDSDDRRIVYHGYRPKSEADQQALLQSLSYNLIPASKMNIYTSEFDGNDPQIVDIVAGYVSHDPVFANTNGNKIVFVSNYNRTDNSLFSLFLYNINYNDGSNTDEGMGLQPLSTMQGTTSTRYAAISNDFNRIVFASNRNSTNPNEFQLFIADFNVTGSSPGPFDGGHYESKPKRRRSMMMKEAEISDNFDDCWQNKPVASQYDGIIHFPGEKHLKNIKQLTFGGQNAEGYFSRDNNHLTIQATGNQNYGTTCDQIYQIDLCKNPAENLPHKMSTGLGACTCSFIYPNGQKSLYAATFKAVKIGGSTTADATCPMKQCNQANPTLQTDPILAKLCNTSYTWDIYSDYDIYLVNEYGIIQQQLTSTPGYDAEGVISPDGTMIAFTSMRNGDLDIYIMDVDGKNVRQITNVTGYDGGAFFSPDSKRLIFRASRPKEGDELNKYKQLLQYNLVEPIAMELFVVNVDGTGMRQITTLGAANWAPYYLHDNKRVIFSSDFNATAGFGAFDLFVINDDGTNLERITWDDGQFDSFPMFNYDGTKLVWGSSRNGSQYDLNLFIADWVDDNSSSSDPTSPTITGSTTTPKPSSASLPTISLLFIVFVAFLF